MKWVQYALIIILVGGFAALSVAHLYRFNFDVPQIEITEALQNALLLGAQPQEVVPDSSGVIDVGKITTPLVAVFDAEGQAVAYNAMVNGSAPVPPKGVFEEALARGENRITWEPEEGTRIALIVRPVGDAGFAVSGKNLRIAEEQIASLWLRAWFMLGFALLLTLALELFGAWRHSQHSQRNAERGHVHQNQL